MADVGWLQLLAAALGGGLTVKLLDIIYQEFRRWSERARSAEQFVDKHLDPLLKAADELVGKLRSLAESDFKELHAIQAGNKALTSSDLASVLFLFGRFWARIEIVRGPISCDGRRRTRQEIASIHGLLRVSASPHS
jgi:hypothetical protein